MTDSLFSFPVIAGAIIVVFLCAIAMTARVSKAIRLQSDYQRQKSRKLEKELEATSKQLLEVRSVVIGLGQKVTEQQDIIQHLHERVLELEQADTDSRLYTRATKMVQLGAELDELIHECELPKAEAELMMSLQKKLAGRESVPPLESSPEERLRQGRIRPTRK
ncbi:DUF2802 domain-containing protein [Vibrio agarivorans]|uniref:DUF2802 domain-containing protein n=1 Tax=Vibrio agarivorans TaxID=153622 RepID=UPI0025B4C01A|nr:DUF2802 domain-containing protein [Vibrio agarivorans]MDN3662867.1 DUF2802 domain-containing protein [Vibrio agarivorans]